MLGKIFISTHPFSRHDSAPLDLLNSSKDWKFELNPLNRKLTSSEVTQFALDATSIIAGTDNLTELILSSKNLKHISRVGIGLDTVPLRLCKEKGIRVSYTPDAVTPAVAELALGFILSVIRHVKLSDHEMRNGIWKRNYGSRVGHLTIGLFGFGRIGKSLVRLLAPFRPNLIVHDIRNIDSEISEFQKQGIQIKSVSLSEVFAYSDLISLHVPAYSKTKHIINRKTLSSMKDGVFIVNTARGELINEKDLVTALTSGKVQGAGLDVFEEEPYQGPLCEFQNVILTQHMGSCSYDCRSEMERQATEECIRFLRGESLLREVPESEFSYQDD